MRNKKTVKIIRNILLVCVSLPFLIALIGIVILQSKPKLDKKLRNELGGQYVTLSKGVTHYELVRPSDSAPIVLMIPGLTVPMAVYNNNVQALHDAGYATLRYDFYGRGLSDRPLLKYTSSMYAKQTVELLDSLGITESVHILGISLGGAIAAEIVSQTPARYKSVTLIGAAVAYSQDAADAKKRAVLRDRLKALKKNVDIDTSLDAYKFAPFIKEQFKYRGAEFAFISLAINESVFNYLPFYKKLAKVSSVPMQIIWGEKDDNFPYSLGVRLGEIISQAEFHTIPGGGHTPHFGQADQVNPLLINFMNGIEGGSVDSIEIVKDELNSSPNEQ